MNQCCDYSGEEFMNRHGEKMEVVIWGMEEVQAVVVIMRGVGSVVMQQVESKSHNHNLLH